jgi:hypothetical protein
MRVMEEERRTFAAVTAEEAGYVLVFNNSGDVLRLALQDRGNRV